MATDARIAVGLPQHPKTKKLIKRLGQASAWNLVCLILWAAANRSDGNLSGMSVEDIELSADWAGVDGALVDALVAVRFLDEVDGAFVLHDWHEHNPWAAGADMRSAKARWNAAKRHHGDAEADRLVPEYAAVRSAASNATSKQLAQDDQDRSNAPSPSPSPSPSPIHNSVTDVTGADAPPKLPDDLTKDELWASGKSLLTQAGMPPKQCGSFVGKLVKDYGDAIVIDAVRSAVVARPADPGEYLKATCMRAAGQRGQRQQSRMTDDERAAFNASEAEKAKRLLFGNTPPVDVIEDEPLGVGHEAG
jgi:hypothetical protein